MREKKHLGRARRDQLSQLIRKRLTIKIVILGITEQSQSLSFLKQIKGNMSTHEKKLIFSIATKYLPLTFPQLKKDPDF